MKTFKSVGVMLIILIGLFLTACSEEPEIQIEIDDDSSNEAAIEDTTETTRVSTVNVGALKNPAGIGFLHLMELNEKNETYEYNSYNFTVSDSTDELTEKLLNGEIDIAAIPTESAAILYNKTKGNIQIASINSTGSLNLIENGGTIKSLKDLSGKTIYAANKGSASEYILNYILKSNSIENVKIEYKEPSELSSLMASGEISIGVLPEPYGSDAIAKNQNLKKILNIADEWKNASGCVMASDCIAVKKDYAKKHPRVFGHFLQECYDSIMYAVNNVSETAALAEKFKIMSDTATVEKTIPDCNLSYIDGDEMKQATTKFLTELHNSNPDSIGGNVPGDDFFYSPKEKYSVKKSK